MFRFNRVTAALAVAAAAPFLTGECLLGQERTVVSNQVEVSSTAASLHLEFSDGDRLTISFDDGTALVDGEAIGTYDVGGTADQSWRGLLSEVLSLTNGPLARALQQWEPDEDLADEDLQLLTELDGALDRAVAAAAQAGRQVEERAQAKEGLSRLLELVTRGETMVGLGEALEGEDLESLDIWLNESHTVPRGSTVEGGILLVDGDLDIRGRVAGDVIVVDGRLTLARGGEVMGDVRLVESELERRGGEVRGDVVDVVREIRRQESRLRDEIREEVRREIRHSFDEPRRTRSGGFLSRTARAVGGVFEALFTFLILGVLSLLLARFGGDRLESVTQAVGENPARSAAVGFAGGFLVLPVYVLGVIVLVVSIVGIPALLLWAPLFPLAVVVGGFMGYLGVSHHLGRWVLEQEWGWLDWADRHNATHLRLVGIGTLLAPFAIGGVVRILPIVGWLGSIVEGLGTLAVVTAMIMGFGAVIITRGGRYANYAFDMDMGADWSTGDADEIVVEEIFEEEPEAEGDPGTETDAP